MMATAASTEWCQDASVRGASCPYGVPQRQRGHDRPYTLGARLMVGQILGQFGMQRQCQVGHG